MKVYEVVTRFYDNGNVKVSAHTYEMERKPENRCIEGKLCDTYYDYFTNKAKAQKHYNDAKRA